MLVEQRCQGISECLEMMHWAAYTCPACEADYDYAKDRAFERTLAHEGYGITHGE